MTYPDGEVVTYHYDEAGQVESLSSNKQGDESTIVEQIGYDKDGHTVYTKLGNGTETEYAYDDVRQRLQEMNLTASGSDIMRNKYSYDAVDNILGINNDVTPTSSTKLGGASSHTYQYDKLNRLISASGNAKDASYTLNMAYNVMSMPLSKEQTTDGSKTAQSYHNYYKYEDADHPSAPSQIGHEHYTYDANGNPTRVENDSTAAVREMYWDEDNRLMVLSDNGKTSRYTYNHAGERAVKSHGSMEGVYINGAPQGITFHETDEYTLYPASIISVNKNRFTKHYFIGDKRVASRIGSGSFNNVYGQNGSFLTAGQQDYAERLNQIETQREDYYRELGIAPGIPTMKGSYGDPENTGVGYNTIIKELGDHSVPAEWAQYVKHNTEADTAPGAPIQWDDPSDPESAQPGYGFVTDNTTEEETFYYHSDHLGSTSYITDKDGNITQYDAYLPYGELLVDEHSSSEEMPYKFNGKELDEETGLYYYGARYMQPMASIWYGVDPLAEKYTNVSGYTYCLGNPVKLVDPDGYSPISVFAKLAAKQGVKAAAKTTLKRYITRKLKNYSSKKWAQHFADDALTAIDMATTESWWEYAIEVIPVAGDAFGGYKLTKQGKAVWKIIQRIKNRTEAIEKGLKETGKLRKALGLTSGEAHHIIPVQLLKENNVVQDAVAAGFDFNGVINGVQAAKNHGPHNKYTNMVEGLINSFKKQNPDYTPEQAKVFLEKLAGDLKKDIQNNKNQLIKK